jgi:hypothetical protein
MFVGVAADFLPRGVVATHHLNSIRAGNLERVTVGLEHDIDMGLIFGHDVFEYPLRSFVGPIWGNDLYPEYKEFAVRLANFRKQHPSLMRPDTFDTVPKGYEQHKDAYKELAVSTRESIAKMNLMIDRYAETKK